MKKLLTALAILASATCSAFEGRVVGVLDGDTIDVLDAQNRSHRIRMAEIDAPEKAQAFGQRAKQHMSALCYGKSAVVTPVTQDQYGRTVGRVSCNGIDANLQMVADGMAWVYRQYAQSPSLFRAEEAARGRKIGLWIDPNPTPPWMWRRAHK